MKKFNNWRRADGFTLVELIVVIAILAILGGVAVPAYSGYVRKAERSADEALLAELNTAFAAACAINGENHIGRNDVTVSVDTATGLAIVNASGIEGFADSFDNFYEGGEFKVFKSLGYTKSLGMIQPPMDYVDGKGNTWQYSQSNIDAYTGSGFEAAGLNTLLGTVDGLVGGLGKNETSLNSLKNSAGFQAYLKEKGLENANGNDIAAALATYTAQSVAGVSSDALYAAISSATDADGKWVYSTALNNVSKLLYGTGSESGEFANKAASAAILYALGTSYANSDYGAEAEYEVKPGEVVTNSGELNEYMNNISSEYFDAYIQDTAKKDVEALLGAFDVVNNNYDVIEDYRTDANGKYNNTNITDVITNILKPQNSQ